MTSKLVHEIIQILFALNETYYAGDGANLTFVEKFKIVPADFPARVHDILYPGLRRLHRPVRRSDLAD